MEIKVVIEAPQLTTAILGMVTLMEEMHLKGNGFVANHIINNSQAVQPNVVSAVNAEFPKIEVDSKEFAQQQKVVADPQPEETPARVEDKPEELEQPKEEPKQEPEPPKQIVKMEDVRAKLAELTKAGKRAEVKALFAEFGATKLSEVGEEHYGELIKKAGEIA